MTLRTVPDLFRAISFPDVTKEIGHLLPLHPQRKYNPYNGQYCSGVIKYAYINLTTKIIDDYKFSRVILHPNQPNAFIRHLADVVQTKTGIRYDVCLINKYLPDKVVNGKRVKSAKLSVHMDNESIFDTSANITSVSFVSNPDFKRRFIFHTRPKDKSTACKTIVNIRNGDLVVGPLCTHYHGLAPSLKGDPLCTQIVFTFRKLNPPH